MVRPLYTAHRTGSSGTYVGITARGRGLGTYVGITARGCCLLLFRFVYSRHATARDCFTLALLKFWNLLSSMETQRTVADSTFIRGDWASMPSLEARALSTLFSLGMNSSATVVAFGDLCGRLSAYLQSTCGESTSVVISSSHLHRFTKFSSASASNLRLTLCTASSNSRRSIATSSASDMSSTSAANTLARRSSVARMDTVGGALFNTAARALRGLSAAKDAADEVVVGAGVDLAVEDGDGAHVADELGAAVGEGPPVWIGRLGSLRGDCT